MPTKPLLITDVVLRDAHQSLFATRLRLDDMLPIAEKLDAMGFWSLETWGGATFDACIRYLGEDPWHRLRELKKAMPNTPQQMLFRGQNILGYRHYADDVVYKFVERAAINGIDVFRIFDAMNDMRNLETAIKATRDVGKHAQGTLSYTISPVHSLQLWLDKARQLEDMGAHSICIKDMAGLLRPYVGYELVSELKKAVNVPIHMHCHATTGLSTSTIVKCVEAGIDGVDTAISSMSMTYGHSPTETVVAIMQDSERDTGINLTALEDIATYFREVRKKYAQFEGSLKGVDARILTAQVPGGMLTNMENQLKEQGAEQRFDEVLAEIPKVRKDLGYIPLVTPTSQIVGTQAVLNVLTGERYKSIAKETAAVLKGEYGEPPAEVNTALQQQVLEGAEPITCRPADLIDAEFEQLQQQLLDVAKQEDINIASGDQLTDDVLTYALFQQVGLNFLKNRQNPSAFEPIPTGLSIAPANDQAAIYTIAVDGKDYVVSVSGGGDIDGIVPISNSNDSASTGTAKTDTVEAMPVLAPLAGNIIAVLVKTGQRVEEGETLIKMEAMKMETNVSATSAGTVDRIIVAVGDRIQVGDELVHLI